MHYKGRGMNLQQCAIAYERFRGAGFGVISPIAVEIRNLPASDAQRYAELARSTRAPLAGAGESAQR